MADVQVPKTAPYNIVFTSEYQETPILGPFLNNLQRTEELDVKMSIPYFRVAREEYQL